MRLPEVSNLTRVAEEAAATQADLPATVADLIKHAASIEADPYVMMGLLIEGIAHTFATAIPEQRQPETASAIRHMLANRLSRKWLKPTEAATWPPARLLSSPGFAASYPTIVNANLIDPGSRMAMEDAWAKGTFEERKVEVFQIENAYVIDECLIFDSNLQVVTNASDLYSDEEISEARQTIEERVEARSLPHFPGLGIVSKRRAASNYGHYLMEMLPIAALGRDLFADRDPRYLVHVVPPPMQDVVFRSFRLLGIPLDRLLVTDFRQPMFFEEIVVIKGLTQHGTYMSPLSVTATAKLATSVQQGEHASIFIKRAPGWMRGRSLVNEAEIGQRLAARGFHEVEPGTLSLEQQIAVFSGASQVVGVSGAAMTNIVFCKPGTKVTMLVPGSFPDTFFWFIATHKQLDYTEVRGDQVRNEGLDPWFDGFTIREADIQYLEALGDTAAIAPSSGSETEILPHEICAHIRDMGDVNYRLGDWIGIPDSGRWIEGFSITPPDDLSTAEFEYYAVLDRGWISPWQAGGTFCGSRGMALPIFGLCIRLSGEAANKYECTYDSTFVNGTRVETVQSGDVCVEAGFSPLEAFRIILSRRVA